MLPIETVTVDLYILADVFFCVPGIFLHNLKTFRWVMNAKKNVFSPGVTTHYTQFLISQSRTPVDRMHINILWQASS